MLILVTGGSGSGKSAYGESLLEDFSGVKYYLATMQIYDEEGRRKVEKHRKNRAGKGFLTMEQPRDIAKACEGFPLGEKTAAGLLECMSNLVANEMFSEQGIRTAEAVADKIIREIRILADHLEELVIVTNNVFEDGIAYEESTMEYLRALAAVNCRLAELADRVTEVVVGIPVPVKQPTPKPAVMDQREP